MGIKRYLNRLVERPPLLYRMLFPETVWRLHFKPRTVYLTFDDGPIPEVTPWVLDTLDHYGVKATFFCVGENVQRNPELFQELLRRGQSHDEPHAGRKGEHEGVSPQCVSSQRADTFVAVPTATRLAPLGTVEGAALALRHHHVRPREPRLQPQAHRRTGV